MSEHELLNAPKTYALLRALRFAHVDVSPGTGLHTALMEFAHTEATKAEEVAKEYQRANPITIEVKTGEEARRLIDTVRSEEREEIARLRALMARAAALAEKLQPDTLAGGVVSLLTAGGPEVEKEADVIRTLAEAVLRNGFWVDGGKDWHSRRCPQSLPPAGAPCTCSDDRAALRLAGRL